jgi:hypothetical protein
MGRFVNAACRGGITLKDGGISYTKKDKGPQTK